MAKTRKATTTVASPKHSAKFTLYNNRYKRNGCTIDQLYRLTELCILQPFEYTEITGLEYIC